MNRRTLLIRCSAPLAALLLAACTYLPVSSSGTGFELAEKTSQQIDRSKTEMTKGEVQLDATLATLTRIMDQPDQDARDEWKQLTRDIDGLEKQVTAIEQQNDRMLRQGGIYFQSWETELATIEDGAMRERSQARRSEQLAQFQRMETSLLDARGAFDPLFADLRDLEQYLSIDVTPAGREAVSDLHDQVRRNATEVKLAVSLAMDELIRMQSVLSPGKPMQKAG